MGKEKPQGEKIDVPKSNISYEQLQAKVAELEKASAADKRKIKECLDSMIQIGQLIVGHTLGIDENMGDIKKLVRGMLQYASPPPPQQGKNRSAKSQLEMNDVVQEIEQSDSE